MTAYFWPPFLGSFETVLPTYLAVVFGYLLGSIPFGLLLTRIAGLGDIRNIGSGNIGATNVLRTGNKKLAALTLVLDGGKGALAALLALNWPEVGSPGLALVAAGAAFVGHLWPVWLGFTGGKGVATFLGVLLALAWPLGLGVCFTWLVVAFFYRYSSLAALLAAAAAPLYAYALNTGALVALTAGMTILIFYTHRENIRRLLKGQESKIGQR